MSQRHRHLAGFFSFSLVLLLTSCAALRSGGDVQSKTSKAAVSGIREDGTLAEERLADSGELDQQEGQEEVTGKKLKIGVTIYRYDDNFMRLYRSALRQYLEEMYNADVLMRNAGYEEEEQQRQVQEFIALGCDGMIVNLIDVKQAENYADWCHEASIPVVFINREPPEEEQERWKEKAMAASCVATDSAQAGEYQGQIILETESRGDLNQDGVVSYIMIMGEPDNDDSKGRSEYCVKALEDGGMRPRLLFAGNGNWEKDEGRRLAREALKLYGRQIEVIFCGNDAMANGALEAVEEAGLRVGRDVYLVGVDALEETVHSIKEGRMTGTVLNDHTGQSHMAADILIQMIQGESVDTRYLVDYVKITATSSQGYEGLGH